MNRRIWRLPLVLLTSGLLLIAWLHLCASAGADAAPTIRYVAADGDCGINTPCYSTLQAAVDASSNGDELRVAAGRYTGVHNRNGTNQLVYLDKSLILRGGYHPQTWAPDPTLNLTILDAQGSGRVLFITGAISPTVDGFHLAHGSSGYGGGVYVESPSVVLSRNQIYANWAEYHGGGVYLKNCTATLTANHIYTNTTGESGRGGGLAIIDSPASVQDNLIEDNRAHVGGGVMMNNTLSQGGAILTGNTIRDNLAFDRQEVPYTFDGAGGGIDLSSYLTDTLRDNLISGNCAKWGGGVHAFGANAILVGNTIQENDAPTHGGGLYVQGGQVALEDNQVLSNTADSWGGGLALLGANFQVEGNTFQGNEAGWRGGGMYADSAALFDSNLFLDNTATEQGGGVFLLRGDGAVHQNSVFVGNQAKEGGGLYIWASDVTLLHSTIAGNTSDDGRAVVIDKYPGLVNPGATTLYTATVVFSNTILAGQPVGFFATPHNRLTVEGILWHAIPTHFQADGVTLAVGDEFTGDPLFQPDGYHLRMYSAARDKASAALEHDVDGQLRDWGNQKDLGADEHTPAILVTPESGGSFTYVDSREEVTLTLDVPPGAITHEVVIKFSPFPPPPPEVLNSPFGMFIPFGPPFRLDTFKITIPVTNPVDPPIEDLSDISDAIIFEHYPAHVIAEIGMEKLKIMYKSMERLELQLLALLDEPSPAQDPACGAVARDIEARTLDVPICDTGILSGTAASLGAGQIYLLAVDPGAKSGYFMFVVEVEPRKIYLPLTRR